MYEGYVLFCDHKTQQECLSKRLFACTDQKILSKIRVGDIVFLYNVESRSLIGPFTALTPKGDELDSGAWAMNIEEHVPSEDIKVNWESLHILYDAPTVLPFLENLETCALTQTQTQRILDLLKNSELYINSKQREASML